MLKMGLKKTHEHESGFFEDNLLSKNQIKLTDTVRRQEQNNFNKNYLHTTNQNNKMKPISDQKNSDNSNTIVIDSDDENDHSNENGNNQSHQNDDCEIVETTATSTVTIDTTDDDVVEVPINNNRTQNKTRNGDNDKSAEELMREIEAASTIRPQGKNAL